MELDDDILESTFEITKISNWIRGNNYKRVCLQFPENQLKFSVQICFRLQEILHMPVFLLGDSNYESCCLDFLSAEHVNADAIVHFGPICFSIQETKIPYLNIFEKLDISTKNLRKEVENCNFLNNTGNIAERDEEVLTTQPSVDIILLVDTPYLYKFNEISAQFPEEIVKIRGITEKIDFETNATYIYIGISFQKLENIFFSIGDFFSLYHYNPEEMTLTPFRANERLVKRRNFLAEKIKDSAVFGLLMATVAVENYMKILGKLRNILKKCDKKCYVISVGRVSPEKLANFPEIDIFVLIGCAMNTIFENQHDYYAPLVAPSDVFLAFSKHSQHISKKNNFSYDFNFILRRNCEEEFREDTEVLPEISLISGKIRQNLHLPEETDELLSDDENRDSQLSLKMSRELTEVRHGANFLASKSWRGLEKNQERSTPKLASEGRSGMPTKYHNEPKDS